MERIYISSTDITLPQRDISKLSNIENNREAIFNFNAGAVSDDYSFGAAEEAVFEEEVSNTGAERKKIEEYLNNTKIQGRKGEMTLGEVLKMCGVNPADIKPDSFKFVSSLQPEAVIELLQHTSSGGMADGPDDIMLAKLLTKSGKFGNMDFSRLEKNAEFLNYLSETKINGKNLLSRISDVSFFTDADYNAAGMKKLLETIKNTGGFSNGAYGLTDLLKSDKINPEKAAECAVLLTKKMNKSDAALLANALNSSFNNNFFDERDIESSECSIADILKTKNIDLKELFLGSNTDINKIADSLKAVLNTGILSDLNNIKNNNSDILQHIISTSADKTETANMKKLINLVNSGDAGCHIFNAIPEKGKINFRVIEDINKLYEAKEKGLNPIDIFVPSFKNEGAALSKLKIGDVFQAEGEDKIRIKTKDGKSELLNISKETYFKLFPPIERYASTQGAIGNCWELTGINALLCDADMRSSVLKLFSEDKNDIIIKIPHTNNFNEIRFKDGKMPDNTDSKYYSNGALGVKMLEYADGKDRQMSAVKFVYEGFNKKIMNASSPEERETLTKQLTELTEFAAKHDDNIDIDIFSEEIFKEYKGAYDTIFSENRVDGEVSRLFTTLGCKDVKLLDIISNDEECQKQLLNPQFFKDNIAAWSTRGSISGPEMPLIPELGLFSRHAYRLEAGNINDKGEIETYRVTNPWSSAFEFELTYEQLIQYGMRISAAKRQ